MDTASRHGKRGRMGERGQMLTVVGLALVVLLGAAALAVDVGYLRYEQRIQQTATDSAAIAGASELQYPSANDVTTAAKHDSALNGYTDSAGGVTVTVRNAPTTGPYSGNASAVEVLITKTYPLFFEKVLNVSVQCVQTRAVGILASGNSNCIYVMNGPATMNSSTINAPSCGLIDNGALTMNSSNVTLSSIGATGTITANSNTYGNSVRPVHASAPSDPCPNLSGCAYLAANPPATTPCGFNSLTQNSWTGTLSPGIYCGGLTLNSSTVTLNPGVYVLAGGMTANSTSFTGTGVTFVVPSGSVTANSATFNLTAPTTGNTKGILFYQPSSNTSGATLNSSSGPGLAGALYFPSAPLTANSSFGTWLTIVAGQLTMNSATVSVPANAALPGSQKVALAE
jgi:hypothetical protein